MSVRYSTVDGYIDQLPADRRKPLEELRAVITKNLPKGFEETISYGMPSFVIPHSKYPSGYHCDPKQPLPFLSFASQKNFIALYHMGLYADQKLLKWFTSEYPKHLSSRPDMGKSCVRFNKPGDLPLKLIGELVSKMTPDDWIRIYEANVKR